MITLASAVPPQVLLNAATLAYTGSVAQSFFWDRVGRNWYVCQRNVILGTDEERLLVTRLTENGDIVDSMHIEHAGHGANIGVENTGGQVYLWTDAMGDGGWATAIARIPYAKDTSVNVQNTTTPPPAGVTIHHPRSSVYRVSATVDPTRRELIYRWQSNDISSDKAVGGIDRYALDAVAAGTYTPLATLPFTASGRSLQGYTSLGDHVYTLYGLPNEESRITCTRWDTGAVVQDEPLTAFPTVAGREPEGLCAYERDGAPATLAFGVVSTAADGGRRFNAGRFPEPETNPWVPVAYDTAVLAPNSPSYVPQYRIAGDQVHLHFSVDRVDKLAWASTTKLFQLPMPARPNRTQRLVGVVSGAYVTGQPLTVRLEVTSDGWVTLYDDRGFKGWVGADVSFWAC